MSDYSHDAAEDGFHEIHLSGKQIVFLFMLVTVASAVIFLCGVLVGRNARGSVTDADTDQVAATTASAAQPAADSGGAAPATEPPAPPTETPDELSYHKRLQGETSQPEAVKPRPEQPSATAPAPQTPPPAAAPAPAAAAVTDVPTQGRAGAWVVQVTALSNANDARDVVRQLAAKGYPAFLVNPPSGMPVIYRVQVGGYPSRTEADVVSRRLEKEERFKPIVRQNR